MGPLVTHTKPLVWDFCAQKSGIFFPTGIFFEGVLFNFPNLPEMFCSEDVVRDYVPYRQECVAGQAPGDHQN